MNLLILCFGVGMGLGTLTTNSVFLEDFNPPQNTDSDASSVIQKAVNEAIFQGKPLIFPSGQRRLRIDSQILISLDSQSSRLVIDGQGATIYPNFEGAGLFVKPLCPTSDIGSGREVAHFEINDLNFDGYFGSEKTRALKIGANGFAFSDFRQSFVQNSLLLGFKCHPILLEGSLTRNIHFRNVVSRSHGWEVVSNDGGFVGDMVFQNCEASGEKVLDFLASGKYKTSELRGIRIEQCNFYGGGISMFSGVFGRLADFWITDTSVDQSKSPALNVIGDGGKIHQLFVQNIYAVGFETPAINIELDPASQSHSGQFVIRGGNISSLKADSAIIANGVSQILLDGITFTDIYCRSAIKLQASKSQVYNCNSMNLSGLNPDYLIELLEGSSDMILSNNVADVYNDLILDSSRDLSNAFFGNKRNGAIQ